MIYVYAESAARARTWCRRNGVEPYGKDTMILSAGARAGRGRMLTAGDRVVVLGRSIDEQVRAVLGPAGLGTVIQPEFPDYEAAP